MKLKKNIKTLWVYVFPLLIGIAITAIIIGLEISGTQSKRNVFFDIFPDSLTNHFPRNKALEKAHITYLPKDTRVKIGGGYLFVHVEENKSIIKFIDNLSLTIYAGEIKIENIFTLNVDYHKQEYNLHTYGDSLLFPFPKFITDQTFNESEIIYYDFKKGKCLSNDLLKENENLQENWQHGYTRGILKNHLNEYTFWLLIW